MSGETFAAVPSVSHTKICDVPVPVDRHVTDGEVEASAAIP
jgi:hypothetical protein